MQKIVGVLVSVLIVGSVFGEDAESILGGYGKTKWGQSKEEVAALVELLAPGEQSTPDRLTAKGEAPFDKEVYLFLHNKLVDVSVHIPIPKNLSFGPAVERIKEIIGNKYKRGENSSRRHTVKYKRREPSRLRHTVYNGIVIRVYWLEEDRAIVVQYFNSKLWNELERQKKKQQDEEVYQVINDMGLEDLL